MARLFLHADYSDAFELHSNCSATTMTASKIFVTLSAIDFGPNSSDEVKRDIVLNATRRERRNKPTTRLVRTPRLPGGGFAEFRSRCPEWCESGTNDGSGDVLGSSTPTSAAALLGLETLRISVVPLDPLVTGDVEDRCDSGLARDDSPSGAADPPFPVQIIPFLFLGNEENSTDLEALERNNIRYVLNVTHNLANAFEGLDRGIKYMKIPIEDHWSQNLSSFFPQAIAFIDEARQKRVGVLVHCLAGVSRSVTVTLAYLMQKHKMPLNDAYDFVKKRKANIAPNFNFLGQLLDFENLLNLKPSHCFCGGSPASSDEGIVRPTSCRCRTLHFTSPTRTTPDSGIDLDRWT
ncbi:dual specificity protein phosphatase 7-like isoform X4 [Ornithodoros turicata]|uniref:dual specificity protein phosphatase 7-like isoform X4 n=1 Tax=Ornithodoros turicata TaxID=34597 RepID=UPI003139CDAD